MTYSTFCNQKFLKSLKNLQSSLDFESFVWGLKLLITQLTEPQERKEENL